ncbi:hypothetical protein V6N11_043991 [Hibiscus sabdariffa]|uniref:RNase H type-1 domain-containing protein n=1 Tax=Hibiscus sabdariffa TaxID=183260 RepID=A0ABR2RE66_9ROSI
MLATFLLCITQQADAIIFHSKSSEPALNRHGHPSTSSIGKPRDMFSISQRTRSRLALISFLKLPKIPILNEVIELPKIARDNGFVHLLIQINCLETVTRLNAPSAGLDVNALVRAIVRLQSAGETTIVRWIPRVENKLADAMAKLDATYDLNLFPAAPMSLLPYLVSAVSV